MNDADYLKAQETLLRLSREVGQTDWTAFLNRIEHSETLGPMLDPTLYRNAMRNLSKIRRLAEGARDFRRVALAISDETLTEVTGIDQAEVRKLSRLPGGA